MNLNKFRRKIAGWILGNQTVVFASREDKASIEIGTYPDLSDEKLGALTRRWFMALDRAHREINAKDSRPLSVMTSQHAVLNLAHMARDVNADEMTIVVRGTINHGVTEHVYEVKFRHLPDYDFGEDGAIAETGDDPDKIIALTITSGNPDYEDWKNGQ